MTPADGYSGSRAKVAWLMAVIGPVALLLLAARLFAAGSLVVRDADGSLAIVVIGNSAEELAVTPFPGGLYLSTARIERGGVARCRNGNVVDLGYVTRGLHVWRTMRARDCRPDASAILN